MVLQLPVEDVLLCDGQLPLVQAQVLMLGRLDGELVTYLFQDILGCILCSHEGMVAKQKVRSCNFLTLCVFLTHRVGDADEEDALVGESEVGEEDLRRSAAHELELAPYLDWVLELEVDFDSPSQDLSKGQVVIYSSATNLPTFFTWSIFGSCCW